MSAATQTTMETAAEVTTIGTVEAAEIVGVHRDTLQGWAREGQLSPEHNGKDGRQRRYFWGAADMAAAMILANTAAMSSREAVEMLGGLVPHLTAAQVQADLGTSGDVILASSGKGVRILREDQTLAEARRLLGSGVIVIVPPTPEGALPA